MPNVGTASVDLEVDGRRLGRNIRSAVTSQQGGINSIFRGIGSAGGSALSAGFSGALRIVEKVGLAVGVASVAVGGFGLKVAADFQQTRIAFEGILGSAEKAQTFLTSLRDFAAKTPFEFPELATAAKQLLAVGFNANDVIPIMTRLGNVAAALGVGGEAINGVVRALGQMKGKGKASAEELNQISEQIPGFSAVKAIAEKMGVSTAEAFKAMETGAVSADFAVEAILEGMERFPGAAGAMERQSKTLNGVISTLKDTFRDALIDGIEPFLPAISDGLVKAQPLIQSAVTGLMGALRSGIDAVRTFAFAFQFPEAIDESTGFPHVVASLGRGVRELVDRFQEAWPQIKQTVSDFVTSAVALFQEHWPTIRAIVVDTLNTLQVVISGIVDSVRTIWGNFGEQIVALTRGHWEGVQTTVHGALDFIRGITETVTAVLHADWADAWDGIRGIFTGAWDFLMGGQEMFNAAFDSLVSAGLEVVASAFTSAWQGIRNVVSDLLGEMVSMAAAFPGNVLGAMGDLAGLLYSAGQDLIRGLINGVRSMAGALVDAAKSVVGSAVNAAKSALGIGSPSKVFMTIGGQVGQGLVIGLERSESSIEQAFRAILEALAAMFSAKATATASSDWMRPSASSAGQSYDALATQITPPTSRDQFIANDQRDPNAGRPGYIQSDDGTWRPGFHTGGIIPASLGPNVPIVAAGGEGVFTREQMAAMGGTMDDATIARLATALAAAIAANPPQITASSIAHGLHKSRRP